MDDLVTFLRARLDEDEQAARAWPNHQQSWEACGPRHLSYASGSGESVTAVNVGGDGPLGWDRIYVKRDPGDLAEHIARHDPARTLREVEAKRMIVDAHGRDHECISLTGSGDTNAIDGKPWALWEPEHTADAERPCFVLRAIALPYADHPDHQDTWRP